VYLLVHKKIAVGTTPLVKEVKCFCLARIILSVICAGFRKTILILVGVVSMFNPTEPDYIKTFDKIAEFAKQFIQEYEELNNDRSNDNIDNTPDQSDTVYDYIVDTEFTHNACTVTLYKPELYFVKHSGFCKECRSTGFIKVENNGIDDNYKACECFYDIPKYRVVEVTAYNINNVFYYVDNGKTIIVNPVIDNTCIESGNPLFYMNKEDCEMYCRRKNNEEAR
jgi:hypothetical protein